jgi:glycosyltransferase involved in cell wall biosynthesis
MLDHYADWGIDRAKLFHVTNGQRDYATSSDGTASPLANDTRETYSRFGFFGQIVDAKGVHIVLRAVDMLRAEGFTDFAVEINGDNINYASPDVRAEIEQFMEEEKQRPPSERLVWFNGSYETRELHGRMSRIDWCIVPSLWWEAFALVISEAWMFKKPVICSNVGAMADRVTNERDGLHFEMGDPAALARTIKRAATEPDLWQRLAGALPTPPSRTEMVEGFRRVYRDAPVAGAEGPTYSRAAANGKSDNGTKRSASRHRTKDRGPPRSTAERQRIIASLLSPVTPD